jgi:hypothetical protein
MLGGPFGQIQSRRVSPVSCFSRGLREKFEPASGSVWGADRFGPQSRQLAILGNAAIWSKFEESEHVPTEAAPIAAAFFRHIPLQS